MNDDRPGREAFRDAVAVAESRAAMHKLYRFFDASGQLLYVGITCNPGKRFDQHRGGKSWWDEIASIRLESHPSRESLLDAERAAIREEAPLYNILLNTPRDPTGRRDPKQPPAPLPCGLKLGEAYALGLANGDCPVGILVEGDEDGVVLVQYKWNLDSFCGDEIWVRANDIERWVKAYREDLGTGPCRMTVFKMDPLGDFQTHWLENEASRV